MLNEAMLKDRKNDLNEKSFGELCFKYIPSLLAFDPESAGFAPKGAKQFLESEESSTGKQDFLESPKTGLVDAELVTKWKEPSVRHTQLDVFRATCVCFVVGCHFFPELPGANQLFVLNWVIQYLSLISGCSWAIARTPVLQYVSRLFLFLAIGCACNSIPIIVRKLTDVHLYHSPVAHGVFFAMWYLLVLIIAVLLLTPLKLAISKNATIVLISFLALLSLTFGVLAGAMHFNAWESEKHIMKAFGVAHFGAYGLNDMPLYLMHTSIHYLIATCGLAKLRGTNSSSVLGWILLVFTAALSVLMPVKRMGMFLQFFQLMVTGFFLYHVPVTFRPRLQKIIAVYWPLIAISIVWLHIDVAHYGSDSIPEDFVDRSRVTLINFLFSAMFAVCWCPCILEKTHEEFGSWRMGSKDSYWISKWSLICYLLHIMVLDFENYFFPQHDRVVRLVSCGCVMLAFFAHALTKEKAVSPDAEPDV